MYFTRDALPVATIPISVLDDRLQICWLAYPELGCRNNTLNRCQGLAVALNI